VCVITQTAREKSEMFIRNQEIHGRLDILRHGLDDNLVGCKTVAAATATEVIEFLSQTPTREEVLAYHASECSQTRLQRLLALNAAGQLGEAEQQELDELQQIEHIIVMLKAQLAGPT